MNETNDVPQQELADLPVTVSVELCKKDVPLAKLLELQPGVVMAFPQHHDGPLPIYIDRAPVGHGHAVDLNDRLGVVVDDVDTARLK